MNLTREKMLNYIKLDSMTFEIHQKSLCILHPIC